MKSQKRDANGFEYRWVFIAETLQKEGEELKEYGLSSYQLKTAFVHCYDRDFPVDETSISKYS